MHLFFMDVRDNVRRNSEPLCHSQLWQLIPLEKQLLLPRFFIASEYHQKLLEVQDAGEE